MAASVLTNSSAMVALQTLRTTNRTLETVNNQISTGKKIASAKDGAAVFAISKVMESDVAGFKAVSDSLSLGSATVSVAANATNALNDLLNEIKGKVVGANESNVDRSKLNDELGSLRDQISSIVSAAQFNGLNLLSNTDVVESGATVSYANIALNTGSADVDVLSSLDRSSGGSVSTSQISVTKQDLGTQTGAAGGLTLAAAAITAAGTATALGAANATYTINGEQATAGRTADVMAGDGYSFDMTTFVGSNTTATGSVIYVARDGDTEADIAAALTDRINFELADQGAGLADDFTVSVSSNVITVTNNTATALGASAAGDMTLTGGGTVSGGLELLGEIDISTEDGAAAGLAAIEGLIQSTIDSQAALGTAQKRVDLQNDFMSTLIDSFKEGIGALVDADLEEASARLQAVQVQQQLGIQALSIANQAPQNILALFR